jgi:hypothetical protein
LREDAAGRCLARKLTAKLAVRTRAGVWEHLAATFASTAHLAAEIARLQAELAGVRLDLANLAAAALATIAAQGEGEPNPLSYLRDELAAQGYQAARNLP